MNANTVFNAIVIVLSIAKLNRISSHLFATQTHLINYEPTNEFHGCSVKERKDSSVRKLPFRCKQKTNAAIYLRCYRKCGATMKMSSNMSNIITFPGDQLLSEEKTLAQYWAAISYVCIRR